MNVNRILELIKKKDLAADAAFSLEHGGPVVRVWIPGTTKFICGLPPIDNEADDRFANFLIEKVKAYNDHNQYTNT